MTESKTCKLSIRLTPSLRKRLEVLAKKAGSRLSTIVVEALDLGLTDLEARPA